MNACNSPLILCCLWCRCDSLASSYSEFDSYKSASSEASSTTTSRPASVASNASSQATLVTGTVKAERPKLSRSSRVNSVSASVTEPVRRDSQASVKSESVPESRASTARSIPRAQSQYASVGEWSESVTRESQDMKKASKSRKSRSSSMSEVETNSTPRRSQSKSRTRSRTASRAGSSRPGSDYEGDLSESEQRETLYLPEDLKVKQREAAERLSVASSAPSSTMEHSTSRMKQLFDTATAGLRSPARVDNASEGDASARESVATVSSNSSNLRRLDSVIGQLEFDEMMSAYVVLHSRANYLNKG